MPSFPRLGQRSRTGWSAKTLPHTRQQSGGRPAPITVRAAKNFKIAGSTVDANGAPLGSCVVQLFRTGDNSLVSQLTSDVLGAFTFTLSDNAGTFYVVAYKPGVTDVAGTSVNTLVAVEQ